MENLRAKLVTFGKGGDTVYYGSGCTGSGYGSPERPHAAHPSEIEDGTPVIDKRAAVETPEDYALVFHGPMVNVDLADDEVDRCPDLSGSFVAQALMSEPGNAYGGLARLHAAHQAVKPSKPGPLDSVSTRAYIDGWRAVGARIGRYVRGQIVWEGNAVPVVCNGIPRVAD